MQFVLKIQPVYLWPEGESAHRSQTVRNYCQEGFSSSSKTLAEDAAADAAIRGGYSIQARQTNVLG